MKGYWTVYEVRMMVKSKKVFLTKRVRASSIRPDVMPFCVYYTGNGKAVKAWGVDYARAVEAAEFLAQRLNADASGSDDEDEALARGDFRKKQGEVLAAVG